MTEKVLEGPPQEEAVDLDDQEGRSNFGFGLNFIFSTWKQEEAVNLDDQEGRSNFGFGLNYIFSNWKHRWP